MTDKRHEKCELKNAFSLPSRMHLAYFRAEGAVQEILYWFRLSRSAMIFKCLLFRHKTVVY